MARGFAGVVALRVWFCCLLSRKGTKSRRGGDDDNLGCRRERKRLQRGLQWGRPCLRSGHGAMCWLSSRDLCRWRVLRSDQQYVSARLRRRQRLYQPRDLRYRDPCVRPLQSRWRLSGGRDLLRRDVCNGLQQFESMWHGRSVLQRRVHEPEQRRCQLWVVRQHLSQP